MKATSTLRLVTGFTLTLMFMLLLRRFVLFLGVAYQAVHWPYGLDYTEGVTWQQANLMFTSQAYGPINGWPAIDFEYTPVYQVTVRLVKALTGGDMLAVGRAVSLVASLFTSMIAGLIVFEASPRSLPILARVLAAVSAGLSLYCFFPFLYWSYLYYVDLLSFFFSMSGFYIGLKAFDRPKLIYVAALCFVAAVYTKQNTVAAPLSLFVLMLWDQPKLALRGIATCIVIGLILLIGLEWATHGGFARHIFLYNMNRVNIGNFALVIRTITTKGLFFGVALFVFVQQIIARFKLRSMLVSEPSDRAQLALLIYFVFASLSTLLILKSGADENYMIGWIIGTSMLIGVALFSSFDIFIYKGSNKELPWKKGLIGLTIPLILIIQIASLKKINSGMNTSSQYATQMSMLSARVRASTKPIISDDMVILIKNGKRVVWEPAIFLELASKGMWDERPFIGKIKSHEFSMFITEGLHGEHYTPAVTDAVLKAYPVTVHVGDYTLHLPAQENK